MTDTFRRKSDEDRTPQEFRLGARVRVQIPDSTDPDHHHHGRTGAIVAVSTDDLSRATGNPRDDYLCRVAFDDGRQDQMLFRHEDLEAQNTPK